MQINIQGYNIELPNEPPHEEIEGYGKPLTEQYWKPPYEYSDDQFLDLSVDDRSQIIDTETERRIFGYWFFNKGKPFYLTGDNYFFLTYWTIDGNKPQFIINQSREFYFDDFVDKDRKCFGSLKLKPRREGCTQRTLSRFVNKATLVKSKQFGIQSKSGEDAQKVNFGNLVTGFDKLPAWMKPQIAGSYPPAEELRFGKPTERMTKSNQKSATRNNKGYLNTRINWRNTVEEAYDGEKLFRYLGDEFSKWANKDIETAWKIIKKCLVDGFDIIGKAYILSTVSEVSVDSAMRYIRLWDGSDHSEKDILGYTQTGLYRWFIPAWATKRGTDPISGEKIINKFGETNEAFAKRALQYEYEALKTAREKYIFLKQNPNTVEDAIRFGMDVSTFDNARLGECQRMIDNFVPTVTKTKVYETGKLHWVNQRFGQVYFEENLNGLWNISHHPNYFGKGNVNKIKYTDGEIISPFSTTQFCMGVDHYDYEETMDEGSQGAALIKHAQSNTYCAEYLGRPEDPNMFYEELIKCAIYYGAKVLPEKSQSGIFNYFKQNGLNNFLIRRPKITKGSDYTNRDNRYGVPASPDNIKLGLSLIEGYLAKPNIELNENVKDNLKDFWFDRCIAQLMNYNYKDKSKYDLVSAMVWTEIAAQSLGKPINPDAYRDNFDLIEYVFRNPEYKMQSDTVQQKINSIMN